MKNLIFITTTLIVILMTPSCTEKIPGCTDVGALNYDSNANTDDGSCISIVLGCIDKEALNFNEDANTDDGSCMNELDVAYEFIKKNLKDPYSAQFESGGSWELPSINTNYPCLKVKYLKVRAKNSWGAYNLETYYVAFKENEIIPELITDNNQSDSEIGFLLELMCTFHEVECNQHKIKSIENKEDKQLLSFSEASFRFIIDSSVNLNVYELGNLEKMNKKELRIARNAIYALYGRSFKSKDLRDLFNSQDWYDVNPNFKDDNISFEHKELIERVLRIEKQN